jgi:hypothetical protein
MSSGSEAVGYTGPEVVPFMRLLRWLTSGVLIALAACSQIVGYDELEKTTGSKTVPEPTKRDASPIDETADDGGVLPPDDSGVTPDTGIPPASTTCPAAPATYTPPWKTPVSRPRPCKTADLDAFVANERQLYETQRQAMILRNEPCANCMYTKEGDANWGPITLTNDQRIFIDFGLCYRAANASEACASKAHELEWCLQKICNVCVAGQNMNDCRAGAMAGTCKAPFDGTVSACNNHATVVNQTCRTSREVVGVLCGP